METVKIRKANLKENYKMKKETTVVEKQNYERSGINLKWKLK